jgi:rSAM/selenodomain-associated transferase 2
MPILSVIVPALNEELALPATLAALAAQQSHPWQVELVLADGGSTDRSVELACAADAVVVIAETGRGSQMRAGAAVATGEVLMFLHADVHLPPAAFTAASKALDHEGVAAGCFEVVHQCGASAGPLTRRFIRLADKRSRTRALPYGDQTLFCTRALYDQVEGIPAVPLMEDVAFARALQQHTTIARLPLAVTTSARRFEQRPIRTTLCWWTFPLLARWGVKPKTLAKFYAPLR